MRKSPLRLLVEGIAGSMANDVPSWRSLEAGTTWDEDEFKPDNLGGDKYTLVRSYEPEDGEWRNKTSTSDDIWTLVSDFCNHGDRDADRCRIVDGKGGIADGFNDEKLREFKRIRDNIWNVLFMAYAEPFRGRDRDFFRLRKDFLRYKMQINATETGFEVVLPALNKSDGYRRDYPETKITVDSVDDARKLVQDFPKMFDLYGRDPGMTCEDVTANGSSETVRDTDAKANIRDINLTFDEFNRLCDLINMDLKRWNKSHPENIEVVAQRAAEHLGWITSTNLKGVNPRQLQVSFMSLKPREKKHSFSLYSLVDALFESAEPIPNTPRTRYRAIHGRPSIGDLVRDKRTGKVGELKRIKGYDLEVELPDFNRISVPATWIEKVEAYDHR